MKHEAENLKKIIQNSLEKFHNSRTSGHTNSVLCQSNRVKPVNAITKSEFQKGTFFLTQGIKGVSQHLEQLAMSF